MEHEDVEVEVLFPPEVQGDGFVTFHVRVGEQIVNVPVCPLGHGYDESVEMSVAVRAANAVTRVARVNRRQFTEWFRQAAHLRRTLGRPGMIDRSQVGDAQLTAQPKRRPNGVGFEVVVSGVEFRVLVADDGAIVDHTEDWERVGDAERTAAMASAVNWVIDNPRDAHDLGIDAGLIRDLWE